MIRTLTCTLTLVLALAVSAEAAEPVRILCIGDSITQGGKTEREEYTYRLPLQRELRAAGIVFDFIGSQRKGLESDATWPELAPGVPFDPDHEGYYGNKTADVVRKVMAAWRPASPAPDIVLIHLGTNDQSNLPHADTVVAPLRGLITFLREKNPRVIVLLGHLNFNDSEGATALRPLIEALAAEVTRPESPVRTVPHFEGWHEKPDEAGSDTFDWAHPNPQGQQKMARHWLAVLQRGLLK